MSASDKFSVRLVTADYYLNYPIPGLDVGFSEFRGTEVKQLPIIRVFGATEKGQKTCLHIHGVFPYLYIPCEEPNPEPKIAYKIANSIDKAINISLKQATSQTQHVYKVTLVQGIPFYGFHTKPHQFYKIFFYNPSFVKTAADLLQNGAILGLSYQPHEAHINFTMQFFLDFNIYGMSYVNIECVKYRRKNNEKITDTQSNSPVTDADNFLPISVPFTSTCEYEVDCLAQHILNRRDVINGNLGANPGLEALWDDEKQRLLDMNMSNSIMPSPSQLRDNIKPTNSHNYYSKKLSTHLATLSEMKTDVSVDSTITLSILNDNEISYEAKSSEAIVDTVKPVGGFLNSSVYPAETPVDSQIINATNVVMHYPHSIANPNVYEQSTIQYDSEIEVDESVIIQCSQNCNASQVELDDEDLDFMAMLKDMESKDVEEDSILGTQTKCIEDDLDFLQQESDNFTDDVFTIDERTIHQEIVSSSDSSDSMKWQDSFWDDVRNISQLDGAWDQNDDDGLESKNKRKIKLGLSRPRKKSSISDVKIVQKETVAVNVKAAGVSPRKDIDFDKMFEVFLPKISPKKSPKTTPKKGLRNFEPLSVTIKKSPSSRQTRSSLRNQLHFDAIASSIYENSHNSASELKTESIAAESSPFSTKHRVLSAGEENLNKTLNSTEEILLRYEPFSSESDNVSELQKNIDSVEQKRTQTTISKKCILDVDRDICEIDTSNFDSNKMSDKYCVPYDSHTATTKREEKNPYLIHSSPEEPAITASLYDRINNFVPEAGTSNILDFNKSSLSILNESQVDESDLGIVSFYNTTFCPDSSIFCEDRMRDNPFIASPVLKNNLLSESTKKMLVMSPNVFMVNDKRKSSAGVMSDSELEPMNRAHKLSSRSCGDKSKEFMGVILTPKHLPPSYYDVISTMTDYNIPLCKNEQPYYSNNKDVGGQIEIGQIVLKLRSKSIIHMKEFGTSIPGIDTIDSWRRVTFMEQNLTQGIRDVKNLNAMLASNRRCILTPCLKPPSFESVKKWLETKNCKLETNLDSKKTHEKLMLRLPCSPGQESNSSLMETITLTPYSPISNICTSEFESTPQFNELKESNSGEKSDQSNKTMFIFNSQNKSTAKKRRFLSQQPKRRLRPRMLRLSLCSKNQSGSVEGDNSGGLSQYSAKSDPLLENESTETSQLEKIQKIKNETKIDDKNNSESIKDAGNLSNSLCFKFSGDNYQDAMVVHEHEYLTVMVMEVLTATRGNMNPDPELDAILAVFYSIKNDCPKYHTLPETETGIIFINENPNTTKMYTHLQEVNRQYKTTSVQNEIDLVEEVLKLISKWDPDILCGYEIEMLSWGYLFQRGFVLNMNVAERISKVTLQNKSWKRESQETKKDIKLIGRIMLDVWRLLRHEIALTSYTFENIMYHIMHERVPLFSFKTLSFWWNHPTGLLRNLSAEFYLTRVTGVVRILQQLDLIGRTSELARLFGIQWYEVLSRGSQFRVESMMIRMTRPRNFVLVSPSMQQRAAMKAPECLPLILEPESRFYSDPVIVLDFQSLYPSMMIAYNYCFSTCLGKVKNMGKNTPYEFGASQLKISPKLLQKLNNKNLINWSPCGVGFVKPVVRKGVLPIMLQDILNTRLMVKRAMKKHKDNKTLQKILHSRQLGLKLIANVTYGYTAANFSGRMPCIEVGDSVVAKGRETLERAIHMVETTPKWNAKVVYGDTDSLFVLVPGRSKSDAFDIGAEIAEAVTNDNPTPVKLKLEKIYQPCILQTKKRYVGFMYESKDQKTPEYNAKGIETVRRDGCPAVAKMLEKTLRILFETYDVSQVKTFICRKFQNIIEGKCSIRDFIFAKEFRGMNSYKPGASVPALEIARRLKAIDSRKEPREGERLPYIITSGAPGQALLRLAYHPRELLNDNSLRLHYVYYITRVIIPPLNRCLTLIGADVNQWFAELPRKQLQLYPILDSGGKQADGKKSTISQYFTKVNCVGCDEQTKEGICRKCKYRPQTTMLVIQNKINNWERKFNITRKICQSCCRRGLNIECTSLDCPVLYRLNTAQQDVEQTAFMLKMKQKLLDF